MVAVCKESYGVDKYVEDVWNNPVYIDEDSDVFRLIWDGTLTWATLWQMATPQFLANAIQAAGQYPASDWQGEGYVLGGALVLSSDGEIIYRFKEEIPGDKPVIQDILDACISQIPVSPEEAGKQYFLTYNG
jgi:AhpC/TSA antioxidant enzyme